MKSGPMQSAKVQYLDGLRGLAALQVVLLHFVTAFMPDIAQHAAPPLSVLFDGHTAVYVFFLISGAVLTDSFARGGAWPGQASKRLVRLGIPVAAAATLSLLLVAALPQAHLRAAQISGSAWLAMDSSGAPTLSHLAREIGLDSLLLGYREYTLFAPIADRLPLLEQSTTHHSGRCIWNCMARFWSSDWFNCAHGHGGCIGPRSSYVPSCSPPTRCFCSCSAISPPRTCTAPSHRCLGLA